MTKVPKINQLTFLSPIKLTFSRDTLPVGTRVRVISKRDLRLDRDEDPTVNESMYKFCGKEYVISQKRGSDYGIAIVRVDGGLHDEGWSWHRNWLIPINYTPLSSTITCLSSLRVDTRHQILMEKQAQRYIK